MIKKQSPFGVIQGGLSDNPDMPTPTIKAEALPLGARFSHVNFHPAPPLADPVYSDSRYLLHGSFENFNSAFTNGDRYFLVFEDTNGNAHYYSYKENIVAEYRQVLLSRLNLRLALALTTAQSFQDQVPKVIFEGTNEWYQLTPEPLVTINELKQYIPKFLTPSSTALKFGITEFPDTRHDNNPHNRPR